MPSYETRKAYEHKLKTKFFGEVPFRFKLIVDDLYESGYMPLTELNNGLGWIYEKPIILNSSKLERTCEDSKIEIIGGFGGVIKTLDQLDKNSETSFMLVKDSESSNIVVCQFKLSKIYSALNNLLGIYKHHNFL